LTAPATDGTCAGCGAPLTPAASYMSALGTVCWACLGRLQSRQERADREAAHLDRSLGRRARALAGVHGGMWGISVIVAADWARFPAWLSTVLLLAVLGLMLGLLTRQRLAYFVALTLDAAGALALVGWAALGSKIGWPIALAAVFPLSLIALTRALRAAYREATTSPLQTRSTWLKPWAGAAIVAAAATGIGAYVWLRPKSDPTLEMMRSAFPAWQAARGRRGSEPGGPAAQALFAQARGWPQLASAFATLDRVWPDQDGVSGALKTVNQALANAGLPYFINAYSIGERPFVLSYRLVARVAWRIGPRSVDVLRLQRLDTLNIELGLLGSTEAGLPVVMLDRLEAMLAKDLPVMYGRSAEPRSDRNAFDRAALDRLRAALEARLGPGLADAAAALAERDRLVEQMRSRLHGGDVQLALPDGFVLGEAWLASLEPEARLSRPGGPLVLDTDLRAVARADQKLREGDIARVLRAAVDLMALTTEAHEARHALDETDPVGPPPPALFEAMPDSSTPMIAMADSELRAILGELHDSALPVCPTLAMASLNVYSRWARRNPHYFATLVILRKLDPDSDLEPAEQLAMLCAVPDAELRRRLAAAWQSLYGAPMPPGLRAPQP
jgi:hypothetical protein